MKSLQLTVLLMAGICLWTACDKQPPAQPANQARPQQPSSEAAKPKQIVVKGFYIGMPREEVIKQATEVFGGDRIEVYPRPGYPENEIDCSVPGSLVEGQLSIDSDNKLKEIFFPPAVVDAVFGAADLNPEEFTKQFVNAYEIPSMESRQTTSTAPAWRYEWRYVSPDGVSVNISQKDKSLEILKTDAGSTKGNFN
jgi:hypothetical protein